MSEPFDDMLCHSLSELAAQWLKDYGYDGLCNLDAECGCLNDDLMPCGEPSANCCQPGYKGPPNPDGGDWAIYTSKAARDKAQGDPPDERT